MKQLKKIIPLFFIVFVTINGYSQEVSKLYHDSGELKAVGQIDENGEGIGEWTFYLKSGEMFALVNYKHNTLNGVYKEYYNSGELFYEMNYTNGKKNGVKKIYYKTGKLKETLNFVDDKQIYDWDAIINKSNDDYESVVHGKCISGDCDNGYGRRERGYHTFEGTFKNGMLHGKGTHIESSYYYTKDEPYKIKYVGNWENGIKTGNGTETGYAKNGNLIYKYNGIWKNDKKNGQGKKYINGKLVYEGMFKNGFQDKLSGCITGDCKNGYGVFISLNKNKYIGAFKNGLKDGFGIETDPKGNYTYGNWKNNKEEGYIHIFSKNNELIFAVEMENGKPLKRLDKKNVEVGCVIGDCTNGFGHYLWDGGMKYVGEFKNNQLQGLGTLTWDEGKYVGHWINGKQQGYGKSYDANGKLLKNGHWDNGTFFTDLYLERKGECIFGNCLNGFGVLIVEPEKKSGWETGYKDFKNDFKLKYQGIWKDGSQVGVGFIEDREGNTYVGQFDYGDYQGKGVANFVNGDMYNGSFDNNAMNGSGTMIYADGSKYIGEWSYNKRHGVGKEYNSNDKLIYSGDYWKNKRDD